ncbi:MAG: RNA methyltransferase [Vicingaceae bacterium]
MKKGEYRKLKLTELNRPSKDEYARKNKIPLIVVLDNIRSLHNIGSVFRTCDAFLVKEIYLSGYTACPPHREIQKTALGATETVKWNYADDPSKIVTELIQDGYKIVPLEQAKGSSNLSQLNINDVQKLALILGNEVEGVSPAYMDAADFVLEIPQEGTKHSLNVSVAAGIAIWEIFKKFH